MGYYAINNFRKDKYMTTETTRETINKIQNADSMRAVKVALELSEANQKSVSKVMEVVSLLDKNLKSLAIKVMELEKKLEAYERSSN